MREEDGLSSLSGLEVFLRLPWVPGWCDGTRVPLGVTTPNGQLSYTYINDHHKSNSETTEHSQFGATFKWYFSRHLLDKLESYE